MYVLKIHTNHSEIVILCGWCGKQFFFRESRLCNYHHIKQCCFLDISEKFKFEQIFLSTKIMFNIKGHYN